MFKQGFDFEAQESYQYTRDNESWPKSEDEIRDLWRKRVKNDWLRLKLADKEDKVFETRSKTLRQWLGGCLQDQKRGRVSDLHERLHDVHRTAYQPSRTQSQRISDIEMKLSLVGIGAVLEEKDEYILAIRELVPGWPGSRANERWRSHCRCGQGDNSVLTDLQGFAVDDAVGLIRGPKDSVVVLDVLPARRSDGKR
jgi:carboxyl-terminal processing protease